MYNVNIKYTSPTLSQVVYDRSDCLLHSTAEDVPLSISGAATGPPLDKNNDIRKAT